MEKQTVRIDELGRVLIPKDIRGELRIKEGDVLEVFLDIGVNGVFLKPIEKGDA